MDGILLSLKVLGFDDPILFRRGHVETQELIPWCVGVRVGLVHLVDDTFHATSDVLSGTVL